MRAPGVGLVLLQHTRGDRPSRLAAAGGNRVAFHEKLRFVEDLEDVGELGVCIEGGAVLDDERRRKRVDPDGRTREEKVVAELKL